MRLNGPVCRLLPRLLGGGESALVGRGWIQPKKIGRRDEGRHDGELIVRHDAARRFRVYVFAAMHHAVHARVYARREERRKGGKEGEKEGRTARRVERY